MGDDQDGGTYADHSRDGTDPDRHAPTRGSGMVCKVWRRGGVPAFFGSAPRPRYLSPASRRNTTERLSPRRQEWRTRGLPQVVVALPGRMRKRLVRAVHQLRLKRKGWGDSMKTIQQTAQYLAMVVVLTVATGMLAQKDPGVRGGL